jgi:hypothetical protein
MYNNNEKFLPQTAGTNKILESTSMKLYNNQITVNEKGNTPERSQTQIKRSKIMKTYTSPQWKSVFALLLILAVSAAGYGQNLILTNNSVVTSPSGSGVIKVAGNIIDTSATSTVTLHNTISLTGTSAQSIGGTSGTPQPLVVDGLSLDSASTKTMNANVQVAKLLALGAGTLAISGKTLTIDSATTQNGGGISVLSTTDSIAYDGVGSFTQPMITGTYYKLGLSGSAKKSNSLGSMVVSGNLNQVAGSGGLSVVSNFTASSTYTFGTIDSIWVIRSLTLTGAGSVNTITGIAPTAQLRNGANPVSISTLGNNRGTINLTAGGTTTITTFTANHGVVNGGGGALSIGSGMTNGVGGVITGGAGLITIAGALTDSGNVTAGAGGITFNGLVGLYAGTIKDTAATPLLTFANGLTLAGGTLSLTNDGRMSIAGSFTRTSGATNFSNASLVNYTGANQVVLGATYGNLTLSGTTGADTAKGGSIVTVVDTLRLSENLVMVDSSKDSLVFSAATGNNVASSGDVIGKVTRSHQFTGGQYYAFNRDSVGLAIKLAAPAARTMTMYMRPGVSPTDSTTLTQNSVRRRFAIADNQAATDSLSKLILYYQPGEIKNGVYSRMGIRSDSSTLWSKVTNPNQGGNPGTKATPNAVVDSNLASSLKGVSEFAIAYVPVLSIASLDWSNPNTWDIGNGQIPIASDDVEIRHNVTANSVGMVAGTLLVDPTWSLNIGNAGSVTISGLFNLNSGTSGGLTLSGSGSLLTVGPGGNLIMNGPVSNNGTIIIK